MGDILYTIKDDFSKNFKKIRKDHGYTQANFKEKYEEIYGKKTITVETIRNWEQGRNVPELQTIWKLCEIFNCDIDYLFGRIDYSTHDLKFICSKIGLSEDAVKYLIKIQEEKRLKETELETIAPPSNLLEKKQQETDRNAITEKQIIQCALDDLIKEKNVLEPVLSRIWEYCHFRHSYDTYEKIDKDKPLSDIERVFLKDPKDRPFSEEDNKNLTYLKDKYDVALFNATRGLADCIEDIYKTKYLDK